jgi:hypothetical protein
MIHVAALLASIYGTTCHNAYTAPKMILACSAPTSIGQIAYPNQPTSSPMPEIKKIRKRIGYQNYLKLQY